MSNYGNKRCNKSKYSFDNGYRPTYSPLLWPVDKMNRLHDYTFNSPTPGKPYSRLKSLFDHILYIYIYYKKISYRKYFI